MSGANYEYCPGCDQKALYVGDQDVPEGVEAWHAKCRVERTGGHPAACECDPCTAPAEARMLLANPVPPGLEYDPEGREPANLWLTRAIRLLSIFSTGVRP